ncbi:hypothetical protein BDC45DRAFT_503819 [Circinella umbellata]|nr:hypothetical protein BDC45DRAFT_503819 [Circinella umbellata]
MLPPYNDLQSLLSLCGLHQSFISINSSSSISLSLYDLHLFFLFSSLHSVNIIFTMRQIVKLFSHYSQISIYPIPTSLILLHIHTHIFLISNNHQYFLNVLLPPPFFLL